MIEFKFDKEQEGGNKLIASGSVVEIAADTCLIIEGIMKWIKEVSVDDSNRYILLIQTGIDYLCKGGGDQ